MARDYSRRSVLQWTVLGGGLASMGSLAWLKRLPPVSAAEARQTTQGVRLRPEIEPLVRLLEETPREQLVERVAERIRAGVSYREILAALLLAGVKNIQPRPSVGFKFHAVLVVNSAHLASLASPAEHRWLPIFWSLDYFKVAQARDVQEGNWTMGPVDESAVPPAHKARQAFITAMDQWDEAAADAAVAALARTAGAHEIYELMFRYGARDFRSIGHKAIFVANSWRTLQCIGWEHAEPVLRSLAYALLMHEGGNPAQRDAEPDRPWRENLQRAQRIRPDWIAGRRDEQAVRALAATIRQGTWQEACDHVVELLNHGVSPHSVWDGLMIAAAELLVRQPGIVSLHALTTSNALHYAWQCSAVDDTRRMLMLQNAAFLVMFREAMRQRGRLADFQLDAFRPAGQDDKAPPLDEIFANVSQNRMRAAEQVYRYLAAGGDARELIRAARLLIFFKGDDSHDYKFSSAVLEDFFHVSPRWRDLFLASSVFRLHGSLDPDNSLVKRVAAALS